MKNISKLSLVFLTVVNLFACNNSVNSVNDLQSSEISSNKSSLKYSFVKDSQIPDPEISRTLEIAQKAADKASKNRDIDYFSLPDNPFGLKINNAGANAYILNYIGTSKNTRDLNIEMRTFSTASDIGYLFNYSGPVTKSFNESLKYSANEKFSNKNNNQDISFELIMGMPPEHIVRSFENFLSRTENILKRLYRPKEINFESDVFIYAVHSGEDTDSFFFESHNNQLVLGERKYADLQIGVVVSPDTSIKSAYLINAFNPKTKLNQKPAYKFYNIDKVDIIEIGDW